MSLLPAGLITGPREFGKAKLLNVLVKEGSFIIHREPINRVSKGKALLLRLGFNWARTCSLGVSF